MTGGVGHQPHHVALAVLACSLVLIVQVSPCLLVTSSLLPHFSSPPLMRSDLVKKVKIPPWPDTETTQSLLTLIRAQLTKLPVTAALLTSQLCFESHSLSGDCHTLWTLVINLSLVLSWPEAVMV